MKIGVVGAGAVGSYYGAKLARAGQEVHFLVRSDYEQVRRHGVKILSPEGNFNARPKVARHPSEIGECDLIMIALKTTANSEFGRILPPLVSDQTAILTLQNGLGNEEDLARIFPAEQILGGLCFVCLNRVSPGVIQHSAHGKIELGEFQRYPEPRTHDIASAFRHAGIPCAVRENLELAHWEKLVWNVPFNGLSVASCAGLEAFSSGRVSGRVKECLTTDQLVQDEAWLELVRRLMAEVIATANAHELRIPLSFADEQVERTRVMGAYKPSTLIDFERGLPVELQTLFLEPLRRAQRKGIPVPTLETLCTVLSALQPST